MIRFDQGNRRFNYRVAGVAIHDDSVLLHRVDRDPFWTLPGGRAEHELSLYFLVRFPPDSMPLRTEAFDGADAGVPLKFRWVPATREALSALPLRPAFLYEGLIDLPSSVTHVVQRD